ncbi:uncharacterized protein CIMG_07389 [Coccidioides immitis RS]|uniref:Uncharacterized protein n=1 Tax=Coccidioides immitis (strain RS) TaxID=246410 RepID=A0A0E1RWG9_COCIM|nr:uncharacterized protein CIMG_07389 [Coccidioides immitis RS]EAS31910.1 hypothetical protein CIMG_07389 [Coccidioides immitis RS]
MSEAITTMSKQTMNLSDVLDPEQVPIDCTGPGTYADPIHVKNAVILGQKFCEKMKGREIVSELLGDILETLCIGYSSNAYCKAKVKFQVKVLKCQELKISSTTFKAMDCNQNLKRIIHGCNTVTYKKYGEVLMLGECMKWAMMPQNTYVE